MTAELLGASATEQADLVRTGAVSARELVAASLEAIERVDRELGAFVALDAEGALAAAERIAPGDERPLCGVPVGIKDLITDVAGLPTTHGSAGFGDRRAERDSPHVERLRVAGAIVIGRTNAPELGLRPVTEPARHGPARNPWDPRLSPGGSSGGSAAAVAAALVPLCDGSDVGGSIRIPACCSGVVGLKPSRGRVPDALELGGLGRVASFGPLARTVLDAAVALDAMAGTREFAAAAAAPPERLPVHVALEAPLGVPVDDAPREAAARAGAALAELGHDVRVTAPAWEDDGFASAWATAGAAGMRELVEALERLHGRAVDPAGLEPETRGWLIESPRPEPASVAAAHARLESFTARMLDRWPDGGVLVTPTCTRLPIEVRGLHAHAGVTPEAGRFSSFLRVFNVTGQPALSLPLGESPEGLPVGVQIVGPPERDDLVLAVAAQLERHMGLRPRGVPTLSALA
jgi:amidase